MIVTELSENEKAVLAQEVAADRYQVESRDTYYGVVPFGKVREGFIAGWDAALVYVDERQRAAQADLATRRLVQDGMDGIK